MTQNSRILDKPAIVKDSDVAAYLRKNPDFLERHPDLLDELITPKGFSGSGVVDFQTIMVEKLKEDKNRISTLQKELLEATQYNIENWQKIQAAVLALLEAEDFIDLVNIIAQDFPTILDVDVCCLVIESYGSEVPAFRHPCLRVVKPGAVRDRLGKEGYAALQDNVFGDEDIYGDTAEQIKSEALIRLDIAPKSHKGILAFGSFKPDTFHPEQAIDQVAFLGQITERFIRQFIEL